MLWNNTPYDDLPKWKQFVRRELSLGSITLVLIVAWFLMYSCAELVTHGTGSPFKG